MALFGCNTAVCSAGDIYPESECLAGALGVALCQVQSVEEIAVKQNLHVEAACMEGETKLAVIFDCKDR